MDEFSQVILVASLACHCTDSPYATTGVVLLDLEEKDLPGIAYRVVEQMVVEELISAQDKPALMRALLLRHRHVDSHTDRFRFSVRRNTASYTSLQVWLRSCRFNCSV